jgi:urease accessory protein
MRLLICIALVAVFASPAFAHTGVGQTHSFASGLLHPFGGADHVIAMASVGIWGVLAGGRAMWVWPATFMATMLGGFAAAILGLQISFVEPAIVSSIVVLGLLVALGVKAPLRLGAVIVGLFAFFHGHAHGTEGGSVTLLPYLVGFALATASLHAAGIGVGLCLRGAGGEIGVAHARQISDVGRNRFDGAPI